MIKIFKNFQKKDIFFVLICIGLIVLEVWLDLLMPDYTKNLTAILTAPGEKNISEVWVNGGHMFACAVGSFCAAVATAFFSSQIAANFSHTLRTRLFDKIESFSDAEINRFTVPSLITRTTNDVAQMQMLIAMGMQAMIKAPILAIWAICKISGTSIMWTSAVLIIIGSMLVFIGIIIAICYPKFKKIQRLTDDLNNKARENISGVRVIRAYNAEDYQRNKFESVNDEITRNNLFTSRVVGSLMPLLTLCMNALTLSIYWIAAILINNESGMPERAQVVEDMTAFTQYSMQVVMAFMMLLMIFIIMPRALVSSKRINEVLDTTPSIVYPKEDKGVSFKGEIEFKNVDFNYPDSKVACLKNISFKVKPGETFAIIGATGCGKTSIINLIPRFYDVTSGEVLIDGVNVKDLSKNELEKTISLAPQKAILFKGDIKSNVGYGPNNDVDIDRVNDALSISESSFIKDLEKGIDSEVAQGGTNFSGGQKQRLSIARAVYKKSKIIIFDDSFSALDYKTDMLVRKNIKEKITDSSIIIVAQRIGTIRNADQIMVIDNGQVVGLGTHKELLNKCKVYKEIALSQLKEEEL